MAINFFVNGCTTITEERLFGLIDVPPSTIIYDRAEDWNVWVENKHGKRICHVAIDDCLNIHPNEGERCEALITYDDVITFIELKDRDGGRWAGKARDQLKNTILLFKRDEDLRNYKRFYAHIANKQRPNFKSGSASFYQQFEDETNFILRISDMIIIT